MLTVIQKGRAAVDVCDFYQGMSSIRERREKRERRMRAVRPSMDKVEEKYKGELFRWTCSSCK